MPSHTMHELIERGDFVTKENYIAIAISDQIRDEKIDPEHDIVWVNFLTPSPKLASTTIWRAEEVRPIELLDLGEIVVLVERYLRSFGKVSRVVKRELVRLTVGRHSFEMTNGHVWTAADMRDFEIIREEADLFDFLVERVGVRR